MTVLHKGANRGRSDLEGQEEVKKAMEKSAVNSIHAVNYIHCRFRGNANPITAVINTFLCWSVQSSQLSGLPSSL